MKKKKDKVFPPVRISEEFKTGFERLCKKDNVSVTGTIRYMVEDCVIKQRLPGSDEPASLIEKLPAPWEKKND